MPNVWTRQAGSMQKGWSEEPLTAPKLLYMEGQGKEEPPWPCTHSPTLPGLI